LDGRYLRGTEVTSYTDKPTLTQLMDVGVAGRAANGLHLSCQLFNTGFQIPNPSICCGEVQEIAQLCLHVGGAVHSAVPLDSAVASVLSRLCCAVLRCAELRCAVLRQVGSNVSGVVVVLLERQGPAWLLRWHLVNHLRFVL
jgi:hypothetical protein